MNGFTIYWIEIDQPWKGVIIGITTVYGKNDDRQGREMEPNITKWDILYKLYFAYLQ